MLPFELTKDTSYLAFGVSFMTISIEIDKGFQLYLFGGSAERKYYWNIYSMTVSSKALNIKISQYHPLSP